MPLDRDNKPIPMFRCGSQNANTLIDLICRIHGFSPTARLKVAIEQLETDITQIKVGLGQEDSSRFTLSLRHPTLENQLEGIPSNSKVIDVQLAVISARNKINSDPALVSQLILDRDSTTVQRFLLRELLVGQSIDKETQAAIKLAICIENLSRNPQEVRNEKTGALRTEEGSDNLSDIKKLIGNSTLWKALFDHLMSYNIQGSNSSELVSILNDKRGSVSEQEISEMITAFRKKTNLNDLQKNILKAIETRKPMYYSAKETQDFFWDINPYSD